jgi:hypothetical protein
MNPSGYEMNIDSVPSDVKVHVWYQLKPAGQFPDSLVGHTAVYCKTSLKVSGPVEISIFVIASRYLLF